MTQNINLFQTKTQYQPVLIKIEQYVRIVAIGVLTILFSGGLIVGASFFIFGSQRDATKRDRDALLVRLKNEVGKESMVTMIRGRIKSIDAILKSQISYAPVIDTTIKLAQSFPITSFAMGEKNSVTLTVNVTTLDEAMAVLSTLMTMEQRKEIVSPILQTFSMDPNKIQIGLMYTVVL